MKKKHSPIQNKLSDIQMLPLEQKEADLVWEHIRFNMKRSSPHKRQQPFSILKRSIALTLIFGLTTGTAFAADSAKPGDLLFPIDRALENVQLSLSSGSSKDALQVQFALERVTEVKDILKEVSVQQTDTSIKVAEHEEELPVQTTSISQTSETLLTPTQQTFTKPAPILKENPDQIDVPSDEDSNEPTQTDFETMDVETEDIPADLETAASGTPAAVKAASSSKPALKKDISDGDKKRIELALGTALSFLGDVKGELAEQGNVDAVEYIDVMLSQINKDIGSLPSEVAFEVHISAKKERVSFEVTSQDNKSTVNIQVKEDKPTVEPGDTDPTLAETETTKAKPKTTESKLEIKDGAMKITTTSNDTTPEKTEEVTEESVLSDEEVIPPTIEEDLASSSADDIDQEKEVDTASSSEDTLLDTLQPEEDGTTSVKVIFKKLDEDFEFTVTDENTKIHNIIDDYTKDIGVEPDGETETTS